MCIALPDAYGTREMGFYDMMVRSTCLICLGAKKILINL